MTISQRSVAVWGDGFVDDGWREMAAVDDWAAICADEYVRLFPMLVPRDGRIPGRLLEYLEEMVAARADHGGEEAARIRIDRVAPLSGRECADESAATGFLTGILRLARTDSLGSVDPAAATTFSYLTSVHPAYLWPPAAVSHERGTTAAWLGVIGRGRTALMPAEVAEYLLDIVECGDRPPALARDSQIAGMIAHSMDVEVLWRAAQRRRGGDLVIVRRQARARPFGARALLRRGFERFKSACSATLPAGARTP